MAKEPKRTIQSALFETIGPIAISELMAMHDVEWGALRTLITRQWQSRPQHAAAKCLMCGSPVFIRSRYFQNLRHPQYEHFSGGDPTCPWFQGRTLSPDAVRAAQYQGNQESYAHRFLCEEVARLVQLDEQLTAVVDKFRRPTENEFGRYPVVLIADRDGVDIFVIEIQLSNTFQTEISARCEHYKREGVPIIWVLYVTTILDEYLPQSMLDVILRHRNNAFVLDHEAAEASRTSKKLLLKCYLRDELGRFDAGRLVSLADLKVTTAGVPYYEDRVSPFILGNALEARRPWRAAFRTRSLGRLTSDFNTQPFIDAFDDLCRRVPDLNGLGSGVRESRVVFSHLLAVVMTTISHAAKTFHNFATQQDNAKAMLNSKLGSSGMLEFLPVMEKVLNNTAASDLLATSVGKHLREARVKGSGLFVSQSHPVWSAMKTLYPEIFDPMVIAKLRGLDALPDWASCEASGLAA